MKKDIFNVVNAADEPELISKVAKFKWAEYDSKKGRTMQDVIDNITANAGKKGIPQVFIAKDGSQPVGIVYLWESDIVGRKDLKPWLAKLYVKESYRLKGVGAILQNRCIQAAKELGFKKIYLMTDHENYYEKTGWTLVNAKEPMPDKKSTTRLYQKEC